MTTHDARRETRNFHVPLYIREIRTRSSLSDGPLVDFFVSRASRGDNGSLENFNSERGLVRPVNCFEGANKRLHGSLLPRASR